jgi:hypothetical protein
MNITNKITTLFLGFVVGVVFVLSCSGDDSPAQVDAATQCDCPAAEPPLAGRIVQRSAQRQIVAMALDGASVSCDVGEVLLSGGCFANSTDSKFTLHSSFQIPAAPRSWGCEFYNGTASPVTSTAYATCLKPAP